MESLEAKEAIIPALILASRRTLNFFRNGVLILADARERILGAALRCFGSRGFEVPISDIAHLAECSEVTVYRLFESKERLQIATLKYASEVNPLPIFLHDLEARDPPPPLPQMLRELAIAYSSEPAWIVGRIIFFSQLQGVGTISELRGTVLLSAITRYVSNLQKHGQCLALKPADAARAICALMLGIMVRDRVLSGFDIACPDTLASIPDLFELLR